MLKLEEEVTWVQDLSISAKVAGDTLSPREEKKLKDTKERFGHE